MNERTESRKRSAWELIPSLIVAVLGTLGVVGLYFALPAFSFIEMFVLLVAVALAAVGCNQGVIRGIVTLLFIYVATGLAAALYIVSAPYIGAPLGGESTRNTRALSFFVITLVLCIVLEFVWRRQFRDTSLPKLRFLDRLGGFVLYVVVGALVATLLFNTIGYSQWGRSSHNRASLRPIFNRVLATYYRIQSFWFPGDPPGMYVYDLDLE